MESRWLDAVGRCYDGNHSRPCRSISDEEAKQIWETLLPNFDSRKTSDSLAGFLMIRRMASISPLFAKDVVSRYFILPVTGVDYSQWKVILNNMLKLSDEDFSNIEKIAGSPIDMNFLYRNLNPTSPDDVLVARNLAVLFGLAERLPYNVAKQFYFSKIL